MEENIKNERDLVLIFSSIYQFIKRYFLILLFFLIAGIAYGFYKNNISTYNYKKHLAISSNVISKEICLEIVKSIQPFIDGNNSFTIAEKLNIPVKAAASIIDIDTSANRNKINNGFIVDILLKDSSFVDTITYGIIHFLSQNEYYQKNLQLYLNEKQNILKTINYKLNSANSEESQGVSSEKHEIVKCSSIEQINLLEKKYELEKDIKFESKFTILNETTVKIYIGIGLLKSILLYGVCFGIIGLIITLIIETSSLTRKFLKQRKS